MASRVVNPPPSRGPVPLFVELCAGTAALSLRLHREKAKPPISRMGAKQGYADAILRVLGLRPGQQAERYVWCDPDDGIRLLLGAYRDHIIAEQAAEILRSWVNEDARELWERLREEGPAKCPPADPREFARFLYRVSVEYDSTLQRGGFVHPETGGRYGAARQDLARRTQNLPSVSGRHSLVEKDARRLDPREVARWIRIISSNRLINLDPQTWRNTGKGGSTFGGREFCSSAAYLAERLESSPKIESAAVVGGAFAPQEKLPTGSICYIDPPYLGTTPYAHDLARPEVVEMAKAWADAGATVCISEAEPIPELMDAGWHFREITWCRRGVSRTFSKQQREFLTMNVPGVHPGRPAQPLLRRKRGKIL